MLDVAALPGADWPGDVDWQALCERAAQAALSLTPHAGLLAASAPVEIAVKLSDDAEVRALNAQWRGKDKPTNILSFPMVQPDLLELIADAGGNADDGETQLGDMILGFGVCAREAAEKGIPLADHVTHLVVHGTLHLVGYDHSNDAEAEHMEALEIRALETLGIANPYGADPYGDRDTGPHRAVDDAETGI